MFRKADGHPFPCIPVVLDAAVGHHALRIERRTHLTDEIKDAGCSFLVRNATDASPPVAKAMDYMLKRWAAFTRFLGDGRICLSNNAAERGVRGNELGRKSWLFCGSDRGGDRAAVMYSLMSRPR